MGFAKPIEQIFIKLSRYIYVSKRYYTRRTNMNEQTIILFFLIVSLGVTLSLYIFKAKKQMNYMGDERWEMIQLKSYRIASISTWLLIIVLLILPIFVDSQSTITIQRLTIFCLFYIGARNLLELSAIIYFDKQL